MLYMLANRADESNNPDSKPHSDDESNNSDSKPHSADPTSPFPDNSTVTPSTRPVVKRIGFKNATEKTVKPPLKRILNAGVTKPGVNRKGSKRATDKTVKQPLKRIRNAGVKKPNAVQTKMTLKSLSKSSHRIPRETVTDSHLLQGLEWGRWKQVLRPHVQKGSPYSWMQRPNNIPGYRSERIFNNTCTSAMFEVAVPSPDSPKKAPVWHGFSNGNIERIWDRHFQQPALKREIDNIFERGCKLYVRRAEKIKNGSIQYGGQSCSTLKELNNLVDKTYDYAWTKSKPRQLFLRRSRRTSVITRRDQPY